MVSLNMDQSLNTIKRSTTADKVFDTLHRWIVSGRFAPGDVLPSQEELAKQLKVSRNTLREAVFRLSALGLVQSKQGVGTVVLTASPSNYIRSLPDHLALDEISLTEFIEARLFTERTIVRMAVARASLDDLEGLAHILTRQKEAVDMDDAAEFNVHDVAFHMALARASGNSVMLIFWQTIWGLMTKFVTRSNLVPGKIQRSYKSHYSIYQAIQNRDPALAEKEMVYHINRVADWPEMIDDEQAVSQVLKLASINEDP
jgi:GntR family transcriptional repressor for pyruvate dehydrogenase complex